MTDKAENNAALRAQSILVLEAFEHVHIDKLEEYERMGSIIDDQVKASEPGMLVHALTKISESDEEAVYRWLEVFDSELALETHLSNPLVITHIEAMKSGVLSDETKLIIYSDWNDTQKKYWKSRLTGANLAFAPMITGFFLKR